MLKNPLYILKIILSVLYVAIKTEFESIPQASLKGVLKKSVVDISKPLSICLKCMQILEKLPVKELSPKFYYVWRE